MAAAEARTAWQRAANRYFVQEDAKRAPKLACGPSSSLSKPQFDAGHGDVVTVSDYPVTSFIPLNWNPLNSNLPSETKWWLHLQPSFGYQKDLMCEQLNSLDVEFEALRAGVASPTSNHNRNYPPQEDNLIRIDTEKNTSGSYLDSQCTKHDPDNRVQEFKAVSSNTNKRLEHKDMGEICYQDELMDVDLIDPLCSKQPEELSLHLESSWMKGEKTEPWWRTADRDDLVSLVARKSHEYIENCDLPRPQTMYIRRGSFACSESSNYEGNVSSSFDQKACMGLSRMTCSTHTLNSPTLGGMDGKQLASSGAEYHLLDSDKTLLALSELGQAQHGSEKSLSYKNHGPANKNAAETQHANMGDPSRAELLEALRHSQTRAREAEKAAQQACAEKEHIIKLFFRQASLLFAYRKWFQILQLENLCLQLKNTAQPISTFLPEALPWTPFKHQKPKKSRHKAAKGKRRPKGYDMKGYAIAFAVGLSLTGAGLLLGWTVGWLLRTF